MQYTFHKMLYLINFCYLYIESMRVILQEFHLMKLKTTVFSKKTVTTSCATIRGIPSRLSCRKINLYIMKIFKYLALLKVLSYLMFISIIYYFYVFCHFTLKINFYKTIIFIK